MTKMQENYFVLASEKLRVVPASGSLFLITRRIHKMALQTGVYQHFKGKYYLVIGEATHSETDEPMVVYQPLYGEQRWFVRPLKMFLETVERDGVETARFRWVG
jgi:hypothetical protein